MARGLDHIVHAVHDLDAAAELYRRLGFTVGARNRHPPSWGTQNHIVQLNGCFIELLALTDGSQIAPHAPRQFSFGAFNREFLVRGQGLAMLVLEGQDAAAEANAFRAAGIGDFEPFHFERSALRPDGGEVRVAFSLAFASNPHAPDIGFFTCQQHHPENFWNPAFQQHPNTAATVAAAVLVAQQPADHRTFLSTLIGGQEACATPAGIAFRTPRGEVEVMSPQAYADEFRAEPPDVARSARLSALRIAVRDLAQAEALLRTARLPARLHDGRRIVGPAAALGATLSFERI